jgi:hypothetical protein
VDDDAILDGSNFSIAYLRQTDWMRKV